MLPGGSFHGRQHVHRPPPVAGTPARRDRLHRARRSGPAALFVHGARHQRRCCGGMSSRSCSDTSRCIAIDLPAHGGTPARDDMSVSRAGPGRRRPVRRPRARQVDLVGNDTGGAIAQIFAARHPDRIRSLTLTNCDCEGNFPPPEFAPDRRARAAGHAGAAGSPAIAADPAAWPTSPLAWPTQHPERVPEEVWRDYLTGSAGPSERARDFERMIAALDAGRPGRRQRAAARADAPTLLVWGTARRDLRRQVGVPPAGPDPRGARGHRGRRREALLPRGAPRRPRPAPAGVLGPLTGPLTGAADGGGPQSLNTSSVNHCHRRGIPSSRRTVGVYPSSSCARS